MKNYDAFIFDLDGVITDTATVHALSYKIIFDEYLKKFAQEGGLMFKEFSIDHDYRAFIDGKPRHKGVEDFLMSRGISLELGQQDDAFECLTICGLGNKKNAIFQSMIKQQAPEVFRSSVDLISDLKKNGVKMAVASSSKNCQLILNKAGLLEMFDVIVDGNTADMLELKGKPQGDIFIVALERLRCEPKRSVIAEDAVSGVQAGRQADVALTIGVARHDNRLALQQEGADIVIDDFDRVTALVIDNWLDLKKKIC